MTEISVAGRKPRMGRPPMNVKPTLVRLPEGVPERIDAIAGPNRRAEFIREAIEKELRKREREVNSRASSPRQSEPQ